MASLQVLSTDTIQATNHSDDLSQKIDLSPWDLVFLGMDHIQDGLLFHKPSETTSNQIMEQLKHSLSSTLSFFPPLAGRLIMTEHDDDTVSCRIACNNVGALFVHAIAESTTIADILEPKYVPPFVQSFFPLYGVKNHQGTSQPLLAVQVTELIDGFFISFTINHVVTDGKSFWHFVNSWAEISRGLDKPTKLPSLDRWFPDGIDRPIRFPFKKKEEKPSQESIKPQQTPPAMIFHFTKQRIAELKSKANAEVGTDKISSFQALLSHIWRSMIRNQSSLDPEEQTNFIVNIDFRGRICPPLPETYFGNAVTGTFVSMKVGELLDSSTGLGTGAWQMNKMILLQAQDHIIKRLTESLLKTSSQLMRNAATNSRKGQVFNISQSPKFDIYGNDLGWGKPVGVRQYIENNPTGNNIILFSGRDEGSIDIQVCLPNEILEAMRNDPEFLDAMTTK